MSLSPAVFLASLTLIPRGLRRLEPAGPVDSAEVINRALTI